ncbi:Flp pilus assembly protein TadD, contains TPR repeat [Tritonibacter mobilis]|uniref:tetratricopeptide repeat protein n=1 Tax=Tritonibacter mobilis TaxID=379347 RepID=UPI000806C74C|nr:tetratricopeptide repeat protein [Tritonibacter mobilis]MBW3241362.1 tetratricopeptide repeat protein [Epibacterium sp. DP7N7-1]MEE2809724.1 tetratricopeptide repeat protein [Pseudomonadota bacterium]PXW84197.1 tetratricopeptide repeat protein [Ruegeria sp. P4]SDW11565.1 Tetratricopeptide repeat-containing protein [Tritonibacter mobilis]VCU59556.1 Flp pilus assembly protein TadD, contains TPR repeat [Tritonibacter mobilis]
MRHMVLLSAGLIGALALASCSKEIDKEAVDRALQDVNVVDESNLNSVVLNSADPNEAVSYFQRSVKQSPDRVDLNRGLAASLIRAKRYTEAAAAWQRVVDLPDAQSADSVELADALIRNNEWEKARKVLDTVPPTHETFKRYRLEAMIADSEQNWKAADSFYDTAVGLTTKPAGVFNNWGYSKLTRGDYSGAERLFGEALRQDPNLFTAKNNLVLARGAQRNYSLPVISMTQTERAQLLHTMALSAVKQGDVSTGEGLLREAIETHPQHFDAAARALEALENG